MADDAVLAQVTASAPRRAFGLFALGALGAMLIYLAFVAPPAGFGFQAMLVGLGALSLWLTSRMWRTTQLALELTAHELRLSDGTCLTRVEDIAGIDRGAFAFKPSQGFTLKLAAKAQVGWHPGMWWRIGRRLGVGGVTSGSQAKIMADVISATIATRAD